MEEYSNGDPAVCDETEDHDISDNESVDFNDIYTAHNPYLDLKMRLRSRCPRLQFKWICLCWGFMAQSTQWGHVERGQATSPYIYWADLVLYAINQYCAHSFARNWQLPFLNLQKGENDQRRYFMINLHERTIRVKDSVLGLNEQMQKFKDFATEIQMVQSDIKEQTSQAALSQLRGSAPGPMQENTSNLQNSHSMERQLLQNTDNSCNNVTTKTSAESTADLAPSTLSNISKSKGDNYVKLKPENFSGNDDFEDFRAQFEITSKING